MSDNTRILIKHGEDQLELAYNSSFLLLEKSDFVSIFLPKTLNSWALHLSFVDNDSVPELNAKIDFIKGGMTITHNKWYGDGWTEYTKPFVVDSTDNKLKIYIKVRSWANRTQPFRKVEISIWQKLPPLPKT